MHELIRAAIARIQNDQLVRIGGCGFGIARCLVVSHQADEHVAGNRHFQIPAVEAETTLISPQFLETIICNRGPRADGTDLGLPETIAVDYSLSTGHSCVAEVTASAFGP